MPSESGPASVNDTGFLEPTPVPTRTLPRHSSTVAPGDVPVVVNFRFVFVRVTLSSFDVPVSFEAARSGAVRGRHRAVIACAVVVEGPAPSAGRF